MGPAADGSSERRFGTTVAAVVGLVASLLAYSVGANLADPLLLGGVLVLVVFTEVVAEWAARNTGGGHQRSDLHERP